MDLIENANEILRDLKELYQQGKDSGAIQIANLPRAEKRDLLDAIHYLEGQGCITVQQESGCLELTLTDREMAAMQPATRPGPCGEPEDGLSAILLAIEEKPPETIARLEPMGRLLRQMEAGEIHLEKHMLSEFREPLRQFPDLSQLIGEWLLRLLTA